MNKKVVNPCDIGVLWGIIGLAFIASGIYVAFRALPTVPNIFSVTFLAIDIPFIMLGFSLLGSASGIIKDVDTFLLIANSSIFVAFLFVFVLVLKENGFVVR